MPIFLIFLLITPLPCPMVVPQTRTPERRLLIDKPNALNANALNARKQKVVRFFAEIKMHNA